MVFHNQSNGPGGGGGCGLWVRGCELGRPLGVVCFTGCAPVAGCSVAWATAWSGWSRHRACVLLESNAGTTSCRGRGAARCTWLRRPATSRVLGFGYAIAGGVVWPSLVAIKLANRTQVGRDHRRVTVHRKCGFVRRGRRACRPAVPPRPAPTRPARTERCESAESIADDYARSRRSVHAPRSTELVARLYRGPDYAATPSQAAARHHGPDPDRCT